MLFYRTLVHALIVLLTVNVIAILSAGAHLDGVDLVLRLLSTAHYLIFSIATAATLNEQRGAILVLLAVAVLLAWPPSTATTVALLIPIAAGLLVGGGARQLFREANRVRRTHGRRNQPVREPFLDRRGENPPADDRPRPLE